MKKQVSKDIERLKGEEARDLGIQDFFETRDKSNRKTQGLVEDTKQVLDSESQIKEDLYKASLEVKSIPEHIKPMFGGIFLTARRNKLEENGIYFTTAAFGKGSDTDLDVDFSDKQIVLSCGPHADQVKPGMEVVLKMDNFKERLESNMAQKVNQEFKYTLPVEIIDGVEYLYVGERDVKYISNTNEITIKPDVQQERRNN